MTSIKRLALYAIPLTAALLLAGCKPNKNCVQQCLAQHQCDLSFQNNPHVLGSQCLIVQNQCEAQCSSFRSPDTGETKNRIPISLPPPVEIRKGPYGAIAYDQKSGAWGMSAPSADKIMAIQSALGFCKEHSTDCVVVDNFVNACAAIAASGAGTTTWAHASTLPVARAKAQANCIKEANDACTIQFGSCYRDDNPVPKAEGNNNKGSQIILPSSEQ